MTRPTAALVLAAGLGTRMRSDVPKVLHPIGGRPMLSHLIDTLEQAQLDKIVVIIGDGMDAVADTAQPHTAVVQFDRLGTAHAALQARETLADFDGDVLVLNGDNPLIPATTIETLRDARDEVIDPAVVVLGFRPTDSGSYGRMITNDDGHLLRIVEAKDATSDELAVTLCNSGMMLIDGSVCFDLLSKIGNNNAKSEFYLTDIIDVAQQEGRICRWVEGQARDLVGVNSQAERADAEAIFQDRKRIEALENGAILIAPETVFFSWNTTLASGVIVEPNVVFGPGVAVSSGARIRAFSHLEQATVASGANVGPFARLRGGVELGENVHIGNFVELKNATMDAGAKASHLTYIGDSHVGSKANIGAGTITCNYDGFGKHRTEIGAGAFIGSNTALVAPVTIGTGAIIGAGSTITKSVADNALSVVRGETKTFQDGATRFRKSRQKIKK